MHELALSLGSGLWDCTAKRNRHPEVLAVCHRLAKEGLTVPVVFMGYCNPFLIYGERKLMQDCVQAGVSGSSTRPPRRWRPSLNR
ncbi:hypothetical protein DFJ73DRAFT_832114 [Zopfochytrium polystomum]|nr:hypothetical protein DFJ73DRAFT_832114 [Zopfochytrium polystomum]